jgi:hippurate hydrolase
MATAGDFDSFLNEIIAIRRDLHQHPELGMEEFRTSDLVASFLEGCGIEVHRNVGRTGVVGVLRSGRVGARIGLRADMDALPMEEATNLPYRSLSPGLMHGCGHDGHTAILLCAAKYLAQTRNFDGTVVFIFQPGEEGCGGALAMLEDGLFERFPCDAIFALHNHPGLETGKFRIGSGPIAAGGGFFDIKVTGRGIHAAYPQDGIDPVLAACHLVTGLQSVVSRNLSPWEAAVVSVTRVVGAEAYNTIPEEAIVSGTARFFSRATGEIVEQAMRRIAEGFSQGLGARAELDFRLLFAPTVNDPAQTRFAREAALRAVGESGVEEFGAPDLGSEDFSFMLEKVPGAYVLLGNGTSAPVHHPRYDFADACIPYGAAFFANLVEQRGKAARSA